MEFIRKLITRIQCIRFGIPYRKGMFIHPTCVLSIPQNVELFIGENVIFHDKVRIDCEPNSHLYIGNGTSFNVRTWVEVMNRVTINEKVLIAPDVYISDRNHCYQDVTKPIIDQGYYGKGSISIGEGTWCGIHSIILGGHHIVVGKGCVIGANSVLTKSIPDYCIVGGPTTHIIKKYDNVKQQWIEP